jgi:hypothetical protein
MYTKGGGGCNWERHDPLHDRLFVNTYIYECNGTTCNNGIENNNNKNKQKPKGLEALKQNVHLQRDEGNTHSHVH